MKISDIAAASGLTVKSIRYYESTGLIPMPPRGDNGYRSYDQALLPTLKLIRRSRAAGFSVNECKELVALLNNPKRHSADVHGMVMQKIAAIDHQMTLLSEVRAELAALAAGCDNSADAQCAILTSLSE